MHSVAKWSGSAISGYLRVGAVSVGGGPDSTRASAENLRGGRCVETEHRAPQHRFGLFGGQLAIARSASAVDVAVSAAFSPEPSSAVTGISARANTECVAVTGEGPRVAADP